MLKNVKSIVLFVVAYAVAKYNATKQINEVASKAVAHSICCRTAYVVTFGYMAYEAVLEATPLCWQAYTAAGLVAGWFTLRYIWNVVCGAVAVVGTTDDGIWASWLRFRAWQAARAAAIQAAAQAVATPAPATTP